ncbi:MAG: hypothetical protein LLF98_13905 [Clostridium sp.]|uniref:hypothetical protein n=1 Tax=Clostridium sp. TaxID=1506 RepID=UPI0025C0369F|nr:hypothetical protein [Clostridium sp.]MCE5222298.1 hypothetical protein [Clostridium sp.]
MVTVLERISARNIILVHGNEDVIRSLGKEVSNEFIGKTFTPACGEEININIRNPRKQLNKNFPQILSRKDKLSEENISELWKFIYENYNNKLLTIEELSYIWSGEKNFFGEENLEVENGTHNKVSEVHENNDNQGISEFKQVIVRSVYFESDLKRLFLFKARREDDIIEDLKPKELTLQELSSIIEEKFKDFEYKKISMR